MGRIGIKDLVKPTDRYVELRNDLRRAEQEEKKVSGRALEASKITVMEQLAEVAVELVVEYRKRPKRGKTGKATTTTLASTVKKV